MPEDSHAVNCRKNLVLKQNSQFTINTPTPYLLLVNRPKQSEEHWLIKIYLIIINAENTMLHLHVYNLTK